MINIGDIETIEQDPQGLLSSYLTLDMMQASMQNANVVKRTWCGCVSAV
ncbi:DUF3212 family protein [Bacillus stratosphericus]|nr:DUF3212 family protein [Bacillus stratosphericus]